jgi:hypothetical protein
MLHQAAYAKGNLFVLTVPDNFSDLYDLPSPVLDRLRRFVSQEIPVYLEGPSQVSLFVYDNGTFIVESFLPNEIKVKVAVKKPVKAITNLATNEIIQGTISNESKVWRMPSGVVTTFEVSIPAHSYRGFRIND